MTQTIDRIQEFKRAIHLKTEAAKDNIPVYFRWVNETMEYRVIKTQCATYESALAHVKFQQSLLAPSTEARS